MGCLNYGAGFNHWFGNIHLSGPCNRSCYFCIGQHMMELDRENNLNRWPLIGIDAFIEQCLKKNVCEINVTGTNTDPLLYKHTEKLKNYLKKHIPNLIFGVRTNGVSWCTHFERIELYDKGSITICSLNNKIYKQMMGRGFPPDIVGMSCNLTNWNNFKINIVLGPENITDVFNTLDFLEGMEFPVKRVNLREPYGQPTIGNILEKNEIAIYKKDVFGNPCYDYEGLEVTYWDVHYTEVESVNLYANGRISLTYPITLGHSDNGIVIPQSEWDYGRHNKQWVK